MLLTELTYYYIMIYDYEPTDFVFSDVKWLTRFVNHQSEETRDWLIEFSHCIAGTNCANSLDIEDILEDAEQYDMVDELVDCIERGNLTTVIRKLNAKVSMYFNSNKGWDEFADSSDWDEFAENYGSTPWSILCQDVWDKIAAMPVDC